MEPDMRSNISPSNLRNAQEYGSQGEFCGNRNNSVIFRHPRYPDEFNQNILLRLNAFDRAGGGLHYGTALVACSLLAGNTRSGYFTLVRNGPKVELQHDQLLRNRCYYFYDGTGTKYGVYMTFKDWSFPHSSMPEAWMAMVHEDTSETAPPAPSNLTSFVLSRDKTCRISEDLGMDYIERSHLCPRSESSWFKENSMDIYNMNESLERNWVVDDGRNAIALRKDIHSAFDDKKFVIVPKEGSWAVHFLGQTNALGKQFHNTKINLENVSAEFLFTRFAWSIFPGILQFLQVGAARDVLVRIEGDDGVHEVKKHLTGEEINSELTSRSRNGGTKKRKLDTLPDETEENGEHSNAEDLRNSADSIATCSEPSAVGFSFVKREWIRSRRPSNPALYCCNYNIADAALKSGLARSSEFGAEFGAGLLCDACLGIEYVEDQTTADFSDYAEEGVAFDTKPWTSQETASCQESTLDK